MAYASRNGANTWGNAVKAMLMLLFVAFTFCYVFYLQCDLTALTQHYLSDGHTHYNHWAGAVIITAIAVILQLILSGIFKVPLRFHALTFLPSAVLLAALTSLVPTCNVAVLIVCAAVLILNLLLLIWISGHRGHSGSRPTFFGVSMPNLAMLTVIMLFIALAGNTDTTLHYELRVQRHLNDGKIDKALSVGEKSLNTSERLTILRAYALSRKGELNERLFEYPVPAGMHTLLPLTGDSLNMIFPPDRIYRWLGAMPTPATSPERFLKVVSTQTELSDSRPQITEYALATLLLNKQIDKFAAAIKAAANDTVNRFMKKHCREATVLYQHLRTKPVITIRDNLTEANYEDFMKLSHATGNRQTDASAVRAQYGDTYWWYYYFVKPTAIN